MKSDLTPQGSSFSHLAYFFYFFNSITAEIQSPVTHWRLTFREFRASNRLQTGLDMSAKTLSRLNLFFTAVRWRGDDVAPGERAARANSRRATKRYRESKWDTRRTLVGRSLRPSEIVFYFTAAESAKKSPLDELVKWMHSEPVRHREIRRFLLDVI